MMPKVSGWEAIAYFRSHAPSIPVIVMTAKDDVESVLTSFEFRTVNYLLKPVQPDTLKAAVAKAIKGREEAGEMKTLRPVEALVLAVQQEGAPERGEPASVDAERVGRVGE